MPGFKEGELILSSTPYAYVLNDEYRSQFCDYCFKENNELKRCGQCSFLYFCDRHCQKKAWEMHKTECKFIERAGSKIPNPIIRLFALVLLKIKKYGFNEPSEKVGDRKVSMASLMSHAEEIKQDAKGSMTMTHFLTLLKSYIGPDNIPPLAEFTEIYGKITINAFVIEHEMGPKGMGLYLRASVFDHSCDPEAVCIFDGTTLNVRMRKSVPHRDIKQIHVSYLDEMSLKEEKQKKLWQGKYFSCTCTVCTSPTTNDLMTKLVSDTPETKEKAVKCKKDVENLFSNGPGPKEPQLRYDICRRLLNLQSGVLAYTNIYKLRTLQAAFEACLRLEKWDDALEMASCMEEPLRMYYGINHPKMGYFLYQYGKILCYLERYPEAIHKLSEAETVLRVTHGEQHLILKVLNCFVQKVMEPAMVRKFNMRF